MRQIIHNPYIREKIEYITGMVSYILGIVTLDPFVDRIISSVTSACVALVVVVITHFLKRYLARKFPIEED